jgi:hypothetical protein
MTNAKRSAFRSEICLFQIEEHFLYMYDMQLSIKTGLFGINGTAFI